MSGRHTNLYAAIIAAVLLGQAHIAASAQGYYGYRRPSYSPTALVNTTPNVDPRIYASLAGKQAELADDRQVANQTRQEFQSYSNRVSDYMRDLESRCVDARLHEAAVHEREQQLTKELPSLKGEERDKAQLELANLKSWMQEEQTMTAQAMRNMSTCERWLQHEKDQVNVANYNASEDEQAISDAQRAQAEAQAAAARATQINADRAYWEERNGDYYYGGGYGYGGYGYGGYGYGGYRRGWGYGRYYHGHTSYHSSGGGGSHATTSVRGFHR